MAKTFIHFTLLFVILVLAQVIVFNHVCLFGVAVPLVFIYFILKLPVSLNVNWVMTLSFLLGLTIDIFSDTQGMNALACTILGASRIGLLRLYFPREDEMITPEPGVRSLGESTFAKYALTVSFVYCLLFFLIASLSFFNFPRMLLKIVTSSLLTFIIIIAIDSLTSRRREKRL